MARVGKHVISIVRGKRGHASNSITEGLTVPVDIEVKRDAAWYWWKFVHNLLIHPFLAWPYEPKWAQRAHDWTSLRCRGGG